MTAIEIREPADDYRFHAAGAFRPGEAAIASAVHEQVWPLLESGQVRVLVHATFPLRAAAEAHRMMEESSHIEKLVLTT